MLLSQKTPNALGLAMNVRLDFKAHKKAIENINRKANGLIKLIQEIHLVSGNGDPFKSERPVGRAITQDDLVGEPICRSETADGSYAISFLFLDGIPYGLKGEDVQKLDDLVSALASNEIISKTASDECIEGIIFDWLRARKRQSTRKWFWTYFKEDLQSKVQISQVYVPIDGLETEVSWAFGNVTFLPLGKSLFDKWEAKCLSFTSTQDDDVTPLFKKMRTDMQGLATLRIDVLAEPRYADQVAFEIAGRVCDALRLFSPQRYTITNRSTCAPLGTSIRPQSHIITISGDDGFSYSNSALDRSGQFWRMSQEYFQKMQVNNFDRVLQLAIAGPSNDFEEHVWKSICAFSKSLTPVDIEDRLAFRVSSLESMLLKSNSEPIGTMVGERMAFLLGKKAKSRQEIVKNFKEIYKMRSDYVHHRKTRNDLYDMEHFAYLAWQAIQTLLHNIQNFSKKQDFFEAVEDLRYGGSGS